MGATFQTHIAGSVEMNVRSEMVRIYRVTDLIHGNEFVQVCTRYYTALGHLFALLAKQPYGEPGAVITDGYPLVMVKPSKRTGALFAIHVFWKKSARGWVFGACPLEEMIFGKDFCLLV